MSIDIMRPCDIENEIRLVLKDYMTANVRPLPKDLSLPLIAIRSTGGSSRNTIDDFMVVLDALAETDAEADELLRNALGILEAKAASQDGALRNVSVNSLANWGSDPMRPDLKLRTLTVLVTAHRESLTITK